MRVTDIAVPAATRDGIADRRCTDTGSGVSTMKQISKESAREALRCAFRRLPRQGCDASGTFLASSQEPVSGLARSAGSRHCVADGRHRHPSRSGVASWNNNKATAARVTAAQFDTYRGRARLSMAIETKSTRFDARIGAEPSKRPRVQHARLRSRFLHLTETARFASLLPREHSARYVALETLFLSALIIALCRVIAPTDPLLLAKAFPWLWLLPLFVALRYGTVAGIGGGTILLAAWALFYAPRLPLVDAFPRDYFIGGFITMLVAGQFSDTWSNGLVQARVSNDYLTERLSVLTNNQFLLRLSHDQLEQELLMRPTTLRDALARLRDITLHDVDAPAAEDRLPGAQRFLETLAHACQIEAAQIYALRDGVLAGPPEASVGEPFELDCGDPLVVAALEELALAHIQSLDTKERARTLYIACAPLLGAGEEVVGVLVVSRLPFLALTASTLQLIFVLCGYYANGVRHASTTRDVLRAFPDCPYDFALECARLANLRRKSGVESSVVLLMFDASKQAQAMFEHIERTNLDYHVRWVVRDGSKRGLIFIMPLCSDVAVDAELQLIESRVRNQFGVGFADARVAVRWVSLTGAAPDGALRQLMAYCDDAA